MLRFVRKGDTLGSVSLCNAPFSALLQQSGAATRGDDGANGAAIMELLFGLQERHGSTLILVTHAEELADRCDRLIRLQDGRVADDAMKVAAQ